jgi:hypothetical protein
MGDDLEIASRLRNLASAWGGLPLLLKAADRLEALAGPPELEAREKIVECIRDAADRGFEAGSRGEARFRFNDIIARADALLSAAPKPEAAD